LSTRAAILDRDGTLIDIVRDEETGTIGVAFHPSQIRFLAGVVDGLRALADAGFALGIATNQPGPAKGQFSREAVARTNAALVERLAAVGIDIRTVQVCMHHPVGSPHGDPALIGPCSCRKPGSVMLERAAQELGVPLTRCWMVGDHLSDVEAARNAGARAALVFDRRRCELCPLRDGPAGTAPDVSGASLAEVAVKMIAG
jgi:D-glycero-D-manno-heptose 1,7-bisphosphate phosphatase